MSERLLTAEKVVVPFAMQFIEPILQVEPEEVGGQYNDQLQVWEHRACESGGVVPLASRIGIERPPTVCTVPTRLSPKLTSSDRGVDD